jgi:hypothetical protein
MSYKLLPIRRLDDSPDCANLSFFCATLHWLSIHRGPYSHLLNALQDVGAALAGFAAVALRARASRTRSMDHHTQTPGGIMERKRFGQALGGLTLACSASAASGAYVAVETFESYANNTDVVTASANWEEAGTAMSLTAITDPTDSGNIVGQVGGSGNGTAQIFNNTISIPDNSSATIFFRFRFTGSQFNLLTGTSHFNTPDAFGDLATIVRIGDGSPSNTQLYGYDSTTYEIIAASTNQNAWYNVWMVINHTSNDMHVYLQSDDDPDYSTQTHLTNGDPHGFRANPGTDALDRFTFVAGGNNNNVLVDDIHIDTSGSNLTNPIPEPATLALMGLAGTAVLGRRRR